METKKTHHIVMGLFLCAEMTINMNMPSKEEQILLIRSQASLDQAWENMEPLFPQISELANKGYGSHTTAWDLEISKLCVQIVSWELNNRILSRDYYVRVVVLPSEGDTGEAMVRITTSIGHADFHVPVSSVRYEKENEDGAITGKVSVRAYRLPMNMTAVILPTVLKDMIIVPESEVTCE